MSLAQWTQELKKQNSASSALDFFIKTFSSPILYFEYESSKSWLQLKKSCNISTEPELCFRLHESDFGFDPSELYSPKDIKVFHSKVQQIFRTQDYQSFSCVFNGKVKSIFTYLSQTKGDRLKFFILDIYLRNFFWSKKWEKANSLDESTGCLNQAYFLRRLFVEISRARRLKLPVSLILLELDQYQDLRSIYGRYKVGVFMQALIRNLIKDSRAYDIFGSMDEPGRVALILPHTSERAAGLKAESFRWSVEGADFSKVFPAKGRLSLSVALGEYPSVGRSADSLFQACLKALSFTQREGGGNLTAVATPPVGFKPDFLSPKDDSHLRELT